MKGDGLDAGRIQEILGAAPGVTVNDQPAVIAPKP
jgi:hypothetical protein